MRKQMAKILTAVLLLGTLTDVSTAKAEIGRASCRERV